MPPEDGWREVAYLQRRRVKDGIEELTAEADAANACVRVVFATVPGERFWRFGKRSNSAKQAREVGATERAVRLVQRSYYPVGALRQGAAVLAAGDRTPGLSKLNMPALVVHGTHDPLVPFENGLRVHRAIPGSKMLALDGVGHDLPSEETQRVLDSIIALARD